jgi:hypothetical protein
VCEDDDRLASSQGGGGGRTLLSHHSTRYSIHMGGELKACVKMMTGSLVVKEGVEGGPSSLTTVPGTVYSSDQRASSQGGGGGRTLLSHHSTRYSICQ